MTQTLQTEDSSSDSDVHLVHVLDRRPIEDFVKAEYDDPITAAFLRLRNMLMTKGSAEREMESLFAKRRAHAMEELEKAKRRMEFVEREEKRMKDLVAGECLKFTKIEEHRDSIKEEDTTERRKMTDNGGGLGWLDWLLGWCLKSDLENEVHGTSRGPAERIAIHKYTPQVTAEMEFEQFRMHGMEEEIQFIADEWEAQEQARQMDGESEMELERLKWEILEEEARLAAEQAMMREEEEEAEEDLRRDAEDAETDWRWEVEQEELEWKYYCRMA